MDVRAEGQGALGGLPGVWFGQKEDRKGKASDNFVVDILNDTYLKRLKGLETLILESLVHRPELNS